MFFFTCLCISYSYAQTNARDSLKQLLQTEKTDTGRVLLLADLSFEYLESKPDTTLVIALEAYTLSKRIDFLKGEALSLNRVSNAYYALGNYPKAMECLLQALEIYEKINNLDGLQRAYTHMGLIYLEQGDYRQSLEYFIKSKELAEKNRNQKSISIVLANIGQNYYYLKIFDSARQYTLQSYNIASKINYSRIVGYSLAILGEIYFETGQYTLALEYYRLSIPDSKKADNDFRLCQTFLGMAKVFEQTGQNDSSLYYAKQSLAVANEKGFLKQVLDASLYISHFFEAGKKLDSAFIYQKIGIGANDSLFSQQKQRQFQSLAFDEKLRQLEIAATELKTKEERKRNLQYAAIVIGLITFIILFFVLSRSIIVKEKFIKFFGIVGLLAVFEFINLYIHPYLDRLTNHSPFWMLAILICIGALLVPLHHKLEKWITKIMVEKNKKIRLAAAKKTIEQLEKES